MSKWLSAQWILCFDQLTARIIFSQLKVDKRASFTEKWHAFLHSHDNNVWMVMPDSSSLNVCGHSKLKHNNGSFHENASWFVRIQTLFKDMSWRETISIITDNYYLMMVHKPWIISTTLLHLESAKLLCHLQQKFSSIYSINFQEPLEHGLRQSANNSIFRYG